MIITKYTKTKLTISSCATKEIKMVKSVTAFTVIKLILQTFIFFTDVTIGIRLLGK